MPANHASIVCCPSVRPFVSQHSFHHHPSCIPVNILPTSQSAVLAASIATISPNCLSLSPFFPAPFTFITGCCHRLGWLVGGRQHTHTHKSDYEKWPSAISHSRFFPGLRLYSVANFRSLFMAAAVSALHQCRIELNGMTRLVTD